MEQSTLPDPANDSPDLITENPATSVDLQQLAVLTRLSTMLPDPSAEEIERQRREEARYRREEINQDRHSKWRALIRQMGQRYECCGFKTFIVTTEAQQAVVDTLREYADAIQDEVQAGNGLVLFGPSGTGKDHLMLAVARTAICAGYEVVGCHGQDLFGQIRDRMDTDLSESSLIRQYVGPAILLLSDPLPPTGKLSEFQSSMLIRIIDGRYRECRPTWVSMNVANSREAEERLGVSIVDRLKHGALACWCQWPSHRVPSRIVGLGKP